MDIIIFIFLISSMLIFGIKTNDLESRIEKLEKYIERLESDKK